MQWKLAVFSIYFLVAGVSLGAAPLQNLYSAIITIAFVVAVDWLVITDRAVLLIQDDSNAQTIRNVTTALVPAINFYLCFLIFRLAEAPVATALLLSAPINFFLLSLLHRQGSIFLKSPLSHVFRKHLYLTLVIFFSLGFLLWAIAWLLPEIRDTHLA